jgi:Fe-S oxidoreductase
MAPKANGNYCCGAGGGAWALPYAAERVYYGRIKARQIQETKAELVIAPCHNCRDQLKKSLNQEYELGIEVKYLWELVADSLVLPELVHPNVETNE